MKKAIKVTTLAASLVLSLVPLINVTASSTPSFKTTPNASSKLVRNSSSTWKSQPKIYGSSTNYYKSGPFETKTNIIKVSKSSGQKINLKTKYFMPVTWNKSGDLGNPQSLALNGKYMYTTISNHSNNGIVVRFDRSKLDKYNTSKALDMIRRTSYTHSVAGLPKI